MDGEPSRPRRTGRSVDARTRPMTTTTPIATALPALSEYLREARRRVDGALATYLPGTGPCPDRLAQAMGYSLMGGGKRLRPILALMAAEACGADPDSAMPA